MKIRVLIADDHQIIRDGLHELLDKQPDMDVVGEAEDGRKALRLVDTLSPDVVVMDVSMPELNGIEATRRITAERTDVKVIALSMHSDRRFVTEMFKAGASGYLLKDCGFNELARAIREVASDRTYLSPAIADAVIREYVRNLPSAEGETVFSSLSDREREVLQLLAEGVSTREIAEKLFVSGKTVETHRQNIMRKLDLRSVAELTKYAIREGLTEL